MGDSQEIATSVPGCFCCLDPGWAQGPKLSTKHLGAASPGLGWLPPSSSSPRVCLAPTRATGEYGPLDNLVIAPGGGQESRSGCRVRGVWRVVEGRDRICPRTVEVGPRVSWRLRPLTHAPRSYQTSLYKINSKMKLLTLSKCWQQGLHPSTGLSEHRALCNCIGRFENFPSSLFF